MFDRLSFATLPESAQVKALGLPPLADDDRYALQFASGEWFVGAEDLHNTGFTAALSEATFYDSEREAERIRDAMMRTQGIRLKVVPTDYR